MRLYLEEEMHATIAREIASGLHDGEFAHQHVSCIAMKNANFFFTRRNRLEWSSRVVKKKKKTKSTIATEDVAV